MDQFHHENYLAVDVFFALSGVVIGNAYETRLKSGMSVGTFVLVRLIRLYPLYILGTACSLITMALGFGPEMVTRNLIVLVCLSVFFLPNPAVGSPAHMFPFNFPAWSLFFELAVNIFYACALRLRFLTNRALLAIMLLSAVGLVCCLYVLPDHSLDVGFTLRSSPAGFCRSGYSFFAGVFLYRLFVSKKASTTVSKTAALVVPWGIMALIAALLLSSPAKAVVPYFDFACVVLVFPVLIYMALHFELTGVGARICQFLGAVSYALYAVHDPLFHSIKGIIERENIGMNDYAPGAGIGFLILLISLCWLLDTIYDWPVRRFLQRRFLP